MTRPLPGVRRVFLVPFLGAFAAVLSSCSPSDDLHPVSGKVLSNGKAANGASVIFHPDEPPSLNTVASSARTNEQGEFTLFTGEKPGAKPGKYVVTVRWPDPNKKISDVQKMMGASQDDAPDLFKGKYETRDKSAIKVEVQSGENRLEPFDLK